jgi:hypothetical protein
VVSSEHCLSQKVVGSKSPFAAAFPAFKETMTALTASTASAEWEMVYVVSCVAMPTMAALVVMLARWKGRKPSAVPLSKAPAKETATGVTSQVSCSDSLAPRNASTQRSTQCRKRVGKCKAEESKEKIIRRVTSCPDFAVVRVVKASGKVPRQVSYSNLKDRKLQEEIARLADRLLSHAERQCEQGPDCECWDGCECGERCESWDAMRECEQMNGKRVWRCRSLSERGRKACASIEALLDRRAAVNRAKRAEVFVTKGIPSKKERGPGSNAAGAPEAAAMQKSSGLKVDGQSRRLRLESKEMGRLDYYNQLRSEFCNTRSASQAHLTRQLASIGQCSVVKFWAETELAKGQPGGFGRWVSEQPEGFGQLLSGLGHNHLWSVSSDGVVESWDSRAGHMPALCHYLRLQDGEKVGGLEVIGSQLLVNVGGQGEIVLDGRKFSEAAMDWQGK